ncbi:MAG: hypothetical protein HRT36_05715 [Alphaproteobacteria bacterium]|nr:hypothetical protein [Alphaproteobacteria bacterium]
MAKVTKNTVIWCAGAQDNHDLYRYTDFPEDDTESQNQSAFQKLDRGGDLLQQGYLTLISISCALRDISASCKKNGMAKVNLKF